MIFLGEFKIGDTFSINAEIKGPDGLPLTGKALNLKCQIRQTNDAAVADCVVGEVTPLGTYSFLVLNTSQWALGEMIMDIQLTEGVIINSSETYKIKVIKDVTR